MFLWIRRSPLLRSTTSCTSVNDHPSNRHHRHTRSLSATMYFGSDQQKGFELSSKDLSGCLHVRSAVDEHSSASITVTPTLQRFAHKGAYPTSGIVNINN